MPEISRFRNIKIRMHFGDREHPPPHFHAKSPNGHAMVSVDGILLEGFLPSAEFLAVREWAVLRATELLSNWERCQRNESPFKIEPLK